jgi:hypothetical protein
VLFLGGHLDGFDFLKGIVMNDYFLLSNLFGMSGSWGVWSNLGDEF